MPASRRRGGAAVEEAVESTLEEAKEEYPRGKSPDGTAFISSWGPDEELPPQERAARERLRAEMLGANINTANITVQT